MVAQSEMAVRPWVQVLVRHAARVGVPGVAAELDKSWPSPQDAEPFWRALMSLGLYPWWADEDRDLVRRQTSFHAIDVLYDAQEACAGDVKQAAAATSSQGGIWLKAMATRSMHGALYPSHHHRLATDVDVWFAEDEIESIATWLKDQKRYVRVMQDTAWPHNYELALASPEGILVELHAALGPRRGLHNWFGRLTPRLQMQACARMVQPLSLEMQLVHAVVHFFQHAGHIKYFQQLELLLLLQREAVRNAARTALLHEGYGNLWAWVVIRLNRLWPSDAEADVPEFLRHEKAALPKWQRGLWSSVLDSNGIWRGPWPYRGPKALAVVLGL